MTEPGKERGQALILLAMWLFFGGGAASALVVYDRPVSEMKAAVEHVIADGGRKDAILSDISQWESGQEKRSEQVNEDREELLEKLRRKDAQRPEVEAIVARLDQKFDLMDWDFLNFRSGVKERVTKAEWAEIVGQPHD